MRHVQETRRREVHLSSRYFEDGSKSALNRTLRLLVGNLRIILNVFVYRSVAVYSFILQYTTFHGPRPGPARETHGPSHGSGRRRHRSSCAPHIMRHGPGRLVKTRGPPRGLCRAAHIKPTSHGLRPGPAHQSSSRWAAAWPAPSLFKIIDLFKILGPARPAPSAHNKLWKKKNSGWSGMTPLYIIRRYFWKRQQRISYIYSLIRTYW